MKSLKLKLNKEEARLMADLLGAFMQCVPRREDYAAGGADQEYWFVNDLCLLGLMARMWRHYYTRLLTCEPNGTVPLTFQEPEGLAFYMMLRFVEEALPSPDHKLLADQVLARIHQALVP